MHRRRVLEIAGTTATIALAGCGNPASGPVRKLTFQSVSVEENSGDVIASVDVANVNVASEELAKFHDVKVHGYTRNGTEVCSKAIGTVPGHRGSNNPVSVETQCSAFPSTLTFSADESPCDDDDVRTVLKIAVYDEGNGWILGRHSRDCGEGLPPESRE